MHEGLTMLACAAVPNGFADDEVTLEAEPFLGLSEIQLFGENSEMYFERIFRRKPPAVGRSIESDGMSFSWLAPGEFMVTGSADVLRAALERAEQVAGDHCLATDRTHACVSFRLFGRKAPDILSTVTPLNLTDEALSVGSVARAPLGEISVFFARLPDRSGEPDFRIVVDQTMADYVVRMLHGPESASEHKS